jgi:hypothetical protein
VLTIGVELAFGNWFTPYVIPQHVIVNRTYVYRQELYQPAGKIVYSRDRFGLRGVHEPLPKVELVTVGGSTTDQRYIGEGETWQDALRSRSGIAVANAGNDGMTRSATSSRSRSGCTACRNSLLATISTISA